MNEPLEGFDYFMVSSSEQKYLFINFENKTTRGHMSLENPMRVGVPCSSSAPPAAPSSLLQPQNVVVITLFVRPSGIFSPAAPRTRNIF